MVKLDRIQAVSEFNQLTATTNFVNEAGVQHRQSQPGFAEKDRWTTELVVSAKNELMDTVVLSRLEMAAEGQPLTAELQTVVEATQAYFVKK